MTNSTKAITSAGTGYVLYKVANNNIMWGVIGGLATYFILSNARARSTVSSGAKKAYTYFNK
jgi:hypothetical protein